MTLETKAKLAVDGVSKERARWRDEVARLREMLAQLRDENSNLRFQTLYPTNYSSFYQGMPSSTEPQAKSQPADQPLDMGCYPEDRLLSFILTEFSL